MKKFIIWGLIITISASPLFRGLFFPLEASIFLSIIALLSVLYFLNKLSLKEPIHFNPWLSVLGSLLVAAYAISFISAVNPRENIETLIQYFEYFVVLIIFYDYFHDKKQLFGLYIMPPIIINGFIAAIIGLEALSKAFPLLNDTLHDDRVGSTFQYYNASVIYFIICLLFTLSLMGMANNKNIPVLLSGIGSIFLLAIFLTGSKGGYLVGAAALLLFIIIQPKGYKLKALIHVFSIGVPTLLFGSKIEALTGSKDYLSLTRWMIFAFALAVILTFILQLVRGFISTRRLKPLPLTIISCLLILSAGVGVFLFRDRLLSLIPQNILERWENFNLSNASFKFRLLFDQDALKLIKDHWLLGLGGGGWTSLYQSVQTQFYTAKAVHNQYFQVFVEAGILGFLTQIALILSAIAFFIKSRVQSTENRLSIIISGFLCAFFAITIHSAIDFELSYPSIALIFWSMMVGALIFDQNKGEQLHENPRKVSAKSIHSIIIILLIILGSSSLSINSLYAVASYNANKGEQAINNREYTAALNYYKEAYRQDPINSSYTFQLAKLYNLFADSSNDPDISEKWRKWAQISAERSVELNPYYPIYLELLSKTYINSNMPLKALESTEKLVKYQPCNSANYNLLARAYLEAGNYYIRENALEKGNEMLQKCVDIDQKPVVDKRTVKAFKDQALQLLDRKE